MRTIKVGVFDEHEIFRRGIEACLDEDPLLDVIKEQLPRVPRKLDVAVVSPRAASRNTFACPLVLCKGESSALEHAGPRDNIYGVLPRGTLTPQQLIAAVHAAAAGLRIGTARDPGSFALSGRLGERCLQVLRLLAEGADTREIAQCLRYSDRTIKSTIHDLQRLLGARSRAQAVAQGIRQGLI